ncbi:MAG: SRPBCC family protein [Elusimicrobia bacterium]|nr:SRPBCC family protein [Elusimicrobiota bacterium]
MAIVEDSVSLLVPARTVWYRLIEFERWDELLWAHIPKDAKIALGDTMRLLGGEGTEMRFGLFGGGVLKQTLRVTAWDPPKRLDLSFEGWNPKSVVNSKNKMNDRAANLMGTLGAVSFACSAEVAPVSDLETRFTFRMEAAFTHPIMGPLLSLLYVIPGRSAMRSSVEGFTSRFAQSFEKPKAT